MLVLSKRETSAREKLRNGKLLVISVKVRKTSVKNFTTALQAVESGKLKENKEFRSIQSDNVTLRVIVSRTSQSLIRNINSGNKQ